MARGRRRRVRALAVDDRVVAALGPLPALVAVHRVVAAADASRSRASGMDGREPRLEVLARTRARSAAACRGRRAARGRGPRDAERARRAPTSATRWRSWAWTPPGPIRPTRVEPARLAAPARRPRGAPAGVEERAVGDRGVDPRQVLEHGPAGAEVEVADLGVAHLARRQADRVLGRAEDGVRPARRAAPRQRGIGAAAIASRAGSGPIPKPSRTTRTIGPRPARPRHEAEAAGARR